MERQQPNHQVQYQAAPAVPTQQSFVPTQVFAGVPPPLLPPSAFPAPLPATSLPNPTQPLTTTLPPTISVPQFAGPTLPAGVTQHLPSNKEQPKTSPSFATAKGPYRAKRTFKVCVLGDSNVGKTSLSFRFCSGRFPVQTEATIGVDFRERTLVIDHELIKVQLWDTAGQERYRQSITAHYFRNVNAVVFVYDVTQPGSFKALAGWLSECEKHGLQEVPRILIGNKCDIAPAADGPARVPTNEAQVFADGHDMPLFETSALADSEADHVESIFMTLVHRLKATRSMHVQSETERQQAKQQSVLLLKASEAEQLEGEGWCC